MNAKVKGLRPRDLPCTLFGIILCPRGPMGLTLDSPPGSFRKLGVPYLGVPIVRILLFRVLY